MKNIPNVPTKPTLRGEWAELQFMTKAAGLGFHIAKPISNGYRWDLIVEHDLGFHRVQIKCTSYRCGPGYKCPNIGMAKRPYTADQIDFLALYIIPLDTWYIFPVSELRGFAIFIRTEPTHQHPDRWAKFREAWDLLKQPGRFNINACADVRWVDEEVEPGFSPASMMLNGDGFSR